MGIFVNFYYPTTFGNQWGEIIEYTNTYCRIVIDSTPKCLLIVGC